MTRLEQKLHLIYGGKNLHIFMFIITPTELGRSDYHSCDNCSAVGPHGSLISWDGYYYEVSFPMISWDDYRSNQTKNNL